MLWAAFSLAYFGFLRSSEFTCNGNFNPESHLARTDISFHPNILHPTSFDPFLGDSQAHYCKVKLRPVCIHSFARLYAPNCNSRPWQPLFSFSCGLNLTRTSHTNNLWTLLNLCDIDSSSCASHSFSIGAATTAGATGILNWLVKLILGRWKSNAYQAYIFRTPKETICQVPQSSASCSSCYQIPWNP